MEMESHTGNYIHMYIPIIALVLVQPHSIYVYVIYIYMCVWVYKKKKKKYWNVSAFLSLSLSLRLIPPLDTIKRSLWLRDDFKRRVLSIASYEAILGSRSQFFATSSIKAFRKFRVA